MSATSIQTERESEVKRWLKERYHSAPCDGPQAKKLKFGDVHHDLSNHFTSINFNAKMVSQELKSTFPDTFSKAVGSNRIKHVFGIERSESVSSLPGTSQSPHCEALERRVRQLEERVRDLEQPLLEMNQLMNPNHFLFHGPNTIENFNSFSMDKLVAEFKTHGPKLYELFQTLGQTTRHNLTDSDDVTAAMSLCTLLKCRSQKVLGVQLLIALMLLARSTNKQAITVLNHAGVCVSYSAAWQYLNKLTAEARYMEVVQSGHWQWVFDNVNIHQRVRHEREDYHSSMLNITARLAVRLKNLPGWEFNWSDTSPQKSRQSLGVSDILPNEEDAAHLELRAIEYMMQFLVTEMKGLASLKKYAPPRVPLHPVEKSEVVPMKVLFKDEKYTSETIDILSQLKEDAGLTGNSQVIVGDQMTCKNMRGSKLWRQTEINSIDKLSWVNEVPGDFHFLWECLRVLFAMFWGSPSQPGSLCNLREVIRRTQVDKGVKVFNTADEFVMHAFRAHLLAGVTSSLSVSDASHSIAHEDSEEWLRTQAENLVKKLLMPQTTEDPVHKLHKSFLHHAFLYVDLREAIRWENGPQIVRHWKWWIPRFIGTGKKNYAAEAANMIANVTADFPKHIAYLAIHNRTVNMEGKPGHGKPVDQMMEHYNLVFKQALHSGGGRLKEKHVEEVSLAVLFLMKASRMTDAAFNVKAPSTTHTVRDEENDVTKMVAYLKEKEVHLVNSERQSPGFVDLTEGGWKKITTTTWLKDTLSRSLEDEILEPSDNLRTDQDNILDLDYELACESLF